MSNWSQEQLDKYNRGEKQTGTLRVSAAEFNAGRTFGTSHLSSLVRASDRVTAGLLEPHERVNQITFFGRVMGMNGKGGLLRMHFSDKAKLLEDYKQVVRDSGMHPITGKVRLELTRYAMGVEPDYDNLVSTGKLLIDAIVRCGILEDDKSSVIAERSYQWVRVNKKEAQKTVVKLLSLP